MKIHVVLEELSIDFNFISKAFGYKNVKSYYASTRRKKVEQGVLAFYDVFMSKKEFKSSASTSLQKVLDPKTTIDRELNNLVAYVNLKDYKTAKQKALKVLEELKKL